MKEKLGEENEEKIYEEKFLRKRLRN